MHIRVGDIVEVISGSRTAREEEKKGDAKPRIRRKVLKVLRDKNKVVVEGVNRVYKHMRKSQKNQQGGRLLKEMPVSLSNVMLVCNACHARTRTGSRVVSDGSKERYCKKCNASMGTLAPPRGEQAKAAQGRR